MVDSPVTNPTPKARFMSVPKAVSAHRELMQRDDLQMSIDFALLEYQRLLCMERADANGAAASHFKTLGALEFVQTLKNLAESPRIPSTPVTGNLNQNV